MWDKDKGLAPQAEQPGLSTQSSEDEKGRSSRASKEVQQNPALVYWHLYRGKTDKDGSPLHRTSWSRTGVCARIQPSVDSVAQSAEWPMWKPNVSWVLERKC